MQIQRKARWLQLERLPHEEHAFQSVQCDVYITSVCGHGGRGWGISGLPVLSRGERLLPLMKEKLRVTAEASTALFFLPEE